MDTSPMDRTDPPTLLDLPRELLHNIVLECNPSDIASISRACQTLHNFVLSDNLLYKEVYLRHYVSFSFILHLIVVSSITDAYRRTLPRTAGKTTTLPIMKLPLRISRDCAKCFSARE